MQPGVRHDQLSDVTQPKYNLNFAPDTSTHEYATFGGMIGNNSCGIHSQMAGRTEDNVEELEILTYDGVRTRVGPSCVAAFRDELPNSFLTMKMPGASAKTFIPSVNS